jgi:rod shape determining protein RodA
LIIVFLAKYLADGEDEEHQLRRLLLSALLILPPMFLIYRQPDLGTALVLAAIWLGMVFAAGIPWRHLGLLGVATAGAVPVIWFSLEGYMQERITSFIGRFLNPAGIASVVDYNTRQALTSIGSGGLSGKGFLHGTQSQLYFLRVRHTDYLFSVLSEELGFVGAMGLMLLFVLLLWRILRVANMARDTFGQLIACGVATMIFFQAFVNIGVNVGLLPVTGLTLPLVSYGGSSLWTTLLGIGLVESVAMRHKKLEFGE